MASRAVRSSIGRVLPVSRIWRQISNPDIPGSITSTTAALNCSCAAAIRASTPLPTNVVSYPSARMPRSSARPMSSSSSTMRTDFTGALPRICAFEAEPLRHHVQEYRLRNPLLLWHIGSHPPSRAMDSVFSPGNPDHESIEEGQQEQAPREAQDELVALVRDEGDEERDHPGVGPEPVPEHGPHQHDLHEAVQEEVHRAEQRRRDVEMACEIQHGIGNEVVRVFDQFVLGQDARDCADLARRDDEEQHASDELEHAVETLESEADPEDAVEQGRLGGCLCHNAPVVNRAELRIAPIPVWTRYGDVGWER